MVRIFLLLFILICTLRVHTFEIIDSFKPVVKRDVPVISEVTPFCNSEPRKLVVKGKLVKFSEFLKPNGTFQTDCGNNTNMNLVYIFSSQKVLIDQDLYAPGIQLFVLAPTWEIGGARLINLKGLSGEVMAKPDVAFLGADGLNGKPGNPGKPGGNFFGVGERFIDGDYLTVSVDGGDGGPGQDGGEGGGGVVGLSADKDALRNSLTCLRSPCNKEGTSELFALDENHQYTTFKCKEEYNYIVYDKFLLPPAVGNRRECSYYIYGNPGVVPGGGGDGGVGGRGGLPGTITIFELSQQSGISRSSSNGAVGAEGRGADGGLFSTTGLDVSFKKTETYSFVPPRLSGKFTVQYVDSKRIVKLQKTLGDNGKNSRGIQDPVSSKKISFKMLFEVITDFIAFLKRDS